ncbi:MAG TPA: hypothetical protein VF420_10535 [Casimicrobiaceae bacterium]
MYLMKKLFQLVALLAAGFSGTAFGAYTLVDIDCPGGPYSETFGINNSDTVVITCFAADFSSVSSYMYDSKKGTFTLVAPAPGFPDTTLTGINDKGEIVGSVFDEATGIVSSFVRSKKGVYTLFTHPGSSDTEARGNNNNGLVGGTYLDDASGTFFGFLYDSGSNTFATPGDLVPNAFHTFAQGVNNQGQVVGDTFLPNGAACTGCLAGRYGYLRNKDGSLIYFQINGARTAARGITDSGVITGYVDTAGGQAGFVTTLASSPSFQAITIPAAQLLIFPGSPFTNPEGIANDGTIVGLWVDTDGFPHSFIAIKH